MKVAVTPPKNQAELIVGIWKKVKRENPPLHPLTKIRMEFTRDGKFTFRLVDVDGTRETKTGKYIVAGNTLRLTSDAAGDDPGRTWEVTIESLNEDELVTAGKPGPSGLRQRSFSKRDTGK